ncbi:MAG: polyprenyl synthetase family protein [Solobacterium sp.]|nr:polyprenyl synthetase family protein [Solobacterium sp.]
MTIPEFEKLLESCMDAVTPSRTEEAMRYSLTAGGKRIRPLLLFEVLKGYGADPAKGKEAAAALEMIHTYSLIHDDLPAMDNDDLRRGVPTCHKQFDEATAILAGDGLLTQAFVTLANSSLTPQQAVSCMKILSEMAGADGMILGQTLDIAEETKLTWEDLVRVHRYKTGCLLSAPLMMAAVIAGHEDAVETWHEAGNALGLAFQIQDDILDVELTAEEFGKSNSDEKNDKITSVTVLGIETAKTEMARQYQRGLDTVRSIRGFDSESFAAMVEAIQKRRK